ncbi:MAG: hypothetical protein LBV55_02380 [Acholeplasmatales bacterium]|jgi:hypothetical protein|nr:hypothetical protein [Acholeplasmatales bacterium]
MNIRIKEFVMVAIFVALIFLFGFVPSIGYIVMPPPFPALTIVHIIVLIGIIALPSIFEGQNFKKLRYYIYPIILGLAFGLTSFIIAWVLGSGPADLPFRNPLVSILPRIIFGFLAMVLFGALGKLSNVVQKKRLISWIITALSFLLIGIGVAYALWSTYSWNPWIVLAVVLGVWILLMVGFYFLLKKIEAKYGYLSVAIMISTIVHSVLVLCMFSIFGKAFFLEYFGSYNFVNFWEYIKYIMTTSAMIEIALAALIGTPVVIAIKKFVIKEPTQDSLEVETTKNNVEAVDKPLE